MASLRFHQGSAALDTGRDDFSAWYRGAVSIDTPPAPTPPPRVYRWPRWDLSIPDFDPYPETRYTEAAGTIFVKSINEQPDSMPPPGGLYVYGKVGQSTYRFLRPFGPGGIHIKRKMLCRRRWTLPSDPRTNAQLLIRARFGRAVQAWRALDADTKATYNLRGKTRALPLEGLNIFIREFCHAHTPEEFQADADYLRDHDGIPPAP